MALTKVKVKMVGENGNAFAIMGKVMKAMKRDGISEEIINKYKEESTSGNYDNLLRTAMKYVEVL